MKIKFYIGSILSLLVIASSCKKQDTDAGTDTSANSKSQASVSYVTDTRPKVVAYFPSYRDPATVSASKYAQATHVFYAFINPDSNGNLTLPNSSRFNTVMANGRAAKCKVGISVAGAANLAICAASTSKTTTLVNNIVNFAVANNLDGVDMDWEFPRTSDGTSTTYANLMNKLSIALHAQNKFLSAAITPGVYSGSVRDGILTPVFGYADFFNIMIYDGLGWDSAEPNQHASYNMAVTSLNYWITTRGMPATKAIVGIPCYGSSSTTSTDANYNTLVAAGASPSSNYFTYNGHSYGYNGTTMVVSKANLAQTNANGLIYWEMSQDVNSTSTSTSLIAAGRNALQIGANPGTFEDFSSGVGRFNRAPTYSGSTVGIATTSTATHYITGSSKWLKVTLNDNTSVTTPWNVRLLSGDGVAANNVASYKGGTLYFWLKTTGAPAGSQVKIYIDDSDGTEASPAINVISDNAWHKYSWNLSSLGGTPFAGGNGSIDARTVTLDAINLLAPNSSASWTSYIDDVGN